MFTLVFYVITTVFLILSLIKNRSKTLSALKKAWKSFENILPQFSSIILLIGILLSIFDNDTISQFIGDNSGFLGVIASSVIGSITLIPGFVAFPTASLLINGGAGTWQIGTFISSLMMVGVITAPIEMKYFGKKVTIARNVLAFLFSIPIGYLIYLAVNLL